MPLHTRTLKIFISLLLAVFVSYPLQLAAQVIDRVVAVVNDDVITFSDLDKEAKPLFMQITEQVPLSERETAMQNARRQVLSQLIDKLIIQQRAQQLGAKVSDANIDATINSILAENNMTKADLQHQLRTAGITEESYRASIRDQILQSKLVNYEVRSRVVITEEKIKEYYNNHYTSTNAADGFHLLQIGFAWNPDESSSTREGARKKAEQVRKMAVEGQSFKELAKSFSDLPSSVDGGDIGVFAQEELAAYMRDAILAMKPGEVSPILETPAGYQFFKLLSSKEGDMMVQAPYESVKEEIQDILYQEEMEALHKKWVEQLRKEAYVKILL